MTSTATLATEFDPRRNSLNLIRLGLATGVAVVHSMFLGFGHQPGVRHTDLGSLFVDAFFVISGFLVTRSLLRLDSLPRYLWHRALRILPGFWTVMVAGAFVVAPLMAVLAGRSATSVFSGTDSSFGYLINNAALLMRQFGIQGLPGAGGNPEVINGSLWTLFYEALCYLMVAALGVVGVLRRRPWTVLALIAALWWLTVATEAGINPLGSSYMLRFALVFLLGAAGRLFADGIPISKYLALGSLAVVVASLFLLDNWHVAGAPAFAYLVLYAVVRLPAWERGGTCRTACTCGTGRSPSCWSGSAWRSTRTCLHPAHGRSGGGRGRALLEPGREADDGLQERRMGDAVVAFASADPLRIGGASAGQELFTVP